jgi:hypothetical protein
MTIRIHPLVERPFEEIERGLGVADAGERDGEMVRRDVVTICTLDQSGQKRPGASMIAGTRAGAD